MSSDGNKFMGDSSLYNKGKCWRIGLFFLCLAASFVLAFWLTEAYHKLFCSRGLNLVHTGARRWIETR